MFSIVRITVLSFLLNVFYQPVSASSNRNNSIDVANEDKGIRIRRPSLSLESSDVYNSSIPTGSVISFAGDKTPEGWLLCDGQQCSSQKYPQLYSVIGMKYVPQDSWIHQANKHAQSEQFFCVPDMRGRTSIGVDNGANRVTVKSFLGASGGEEKHLLTVAEMPEHSHSIQFMKPGGAFQTHSDGAKLVVMPKTANDQGIERASLNSTGQDKTHNNMQPYLVLNYIIKTGQEEFDNQRHKTAQRDIELDNQRSEIAQLKHKLDDLNQLKEKLSTLEMASAKAWVVFNGTDTKILDSYNVSSILKHSPGVYTIKFSKPFDSENYCAVSTSGHGSFSPHGMFSVGPYLEQKKDSFKIATVGTDGHLCPVDCEFISACFYGKQ